MSSPETENRIKPRKSRIARIAKWTVLVFVLLLLANWIGTSIVAGKNQETIDHFFDRIGASSFEEYAHAGKRGDLFTGNGWYLFLGALSVADRAALDAMENRVPEGEELTDAQKQGREQTLDRVHVLLDEARKAPYSIAIYNYRDPLSIEQPHTFEVVSYVLLAASSACSHAAAGDLAKSGERLADALAMTKGVMRLPSFLTAMVRHAAFGIVADALAEMIQDLPLSCLEELADLIGSLDLEKGFANGLVGELFFGLEGLELLSFDVERFGAEQTQRSFGFTLLRALTSAYWELDKSVYLDAMIPMVLEPSLESSRRVSADSIPSWAFMARHFMTPLAGRYVTHRKTVARRAVILEALRLERGRRETGEWPEPRTLSEKVPIIVTRNGDDLEIATPLQEGTKDKNEEPFSVTLHG
jgi:hypothetical protein